MGGFDVEVTLKDKLWSGSSIVGMPISDIRSTVCQNPCSGHGVCNADTRACMCDTFWMPNIYYFWGISEANCGRFFLWNGMKKKQQYFSISKWLEIDWSTFLVSFCPQIGPFYMLWLVSSSCSSWYRQFVLRSHAIAELQSPEHVPRRKSMLCLSQMTTKFQHVSQSHHWRMKTEQSLKMMIFYF